MILPLFLAGCRFHGPDCIDETRLVDVTARLAQVGVPAPADSGTAFLGLGESRNHRTKNTSSETIIWDVRKSDVVRAHVSAVHVHERANDRLLLTVPMDTLTNSLAITISYTMMPRPSSSVSWADIYEIVGSERAYMDVHIGGPSPRVIQGDLRRTNETAGRDWRAFQHAYCS